MDPGHKCGPFLWGTRKCNLHSQKEKSKEELAGPPFTSVAFGLEDNFADPLAHEQSIVVIQTPGFAFEGLDERLLAAAGGCRDVW